MAQRILVIGATGLLGGPVADGLCEAGFTVRVMSRDVHRYRRPEAANKAFYVHGPEETRSHALGDAA